MEVLLFALLWLFLALFFGLTTAAIFGRRDEDSYDDWWRDQ